jgi:hypothetical protein
VKHGYHALAIDERRAQFPPTLWSGPFEPTQIVEQVWFTGAHSDVGGGEPSDGPGTTALSDITLAWMMDKAAALGAEFDPEVLAQYKCPLKPEYALDVFHESWKIFCGFPIRRSVPANASISNSVLIRCTDESNWRPKNLSFVNGSLANSYAIVNVCSDPETMTAGAAAAASSAASNTGTQSAGSGI